ncbi:MAG: FAD-dependent oxidoreductase, partial [Terriglobales bacterium]
AAIEQKGGEVTFRSPLRGLRIENGKLLAALFDDGREESADAYVLALPHTTLSELLPEGLKRTDTALGNLDKIIDASITGVHLWFDRRVMTEPFLSLLDTTTQWIFNKTALYAGTNGAASATDKGQYLQLVISASHDLLQMPRQEIIDLCLKEVRHALPAAREANLLKATVIKEAAATFSPQPGIDRWRPMQQTNIGGLFLAGDWTATGWPATMEGAVRSGNLAAEALSRSTKLDGKFLVPDLPASGLMKLFS